MALLADAAGFGSQTTTLALVLLPVVFFLGITAYARLVQINTEEFELVLAMNRLRHAYLQIKPGLERYLTTGYHDDERGVAEVPQPAESREIVRGAKRRLATDDCSSRRRSSTRWFSYT